MSVNKFKIVYNNRELNVQGWSVYDIHGWDTSLHKDEPGYHLIIDTPKGKTKYISISKTDLQQMLAEVNERLNPPKKNLAYGNATTNSSVFKFSQTDAEGNVIPGTGTFPDQVCCGGSCGCR